MELTETRQKVRQTIKISISLITNSNSFFTIVNQIKKYQKRLAYGG